MAKVIPVLGDKGFVTDLPIMVDEAMSNFYLTQRSQSDSFRGKLTSLADILRLYGNHSADLRVQMKTILGDYLERQFSYVDLTITTVDSPTSIQLQISAILGNGIDQMDIVHGIEYTDSRIKAIIDLQNDGKPVIPADVLALKTT